jgi:protein-arginine kinase activator protein McsA
MSDDLVKRLRLIGEKRLQCTACYKFIDTADEAADRIEKLETNFQLQLEWYLSNKRVLDDRIEKLEAALRKIIDRAEFKNSEYVTDIVCRIAKEALEGKDD